MAFHAGADYTPLAPDRHALCAAEMIAYRREIDGLRAVALLPVILFHAGFPAFSGGYVGVDVFFVISGYLITSLILTEQAAGTYSIARFYERRARRILPALLFMLAACIPVAWRLMLPGDFREFLHSLLAATLFSSNYYFWSDTGYFAAAAELKPLLHTWSLAVEEQYYVVFPVLLLAVSRLRRRWLPASLLAMAVASLLWAQWSVWRDAGSAFFLLPSRGWELLLGALLAVDIAASTGSWTDRLLARAGHRDLVGGAGLLMILVAVATFDAESHVPGVSALLPTVGTALIIAAATERTLVGRLLGARWLSGIGLLSYSGYLWHQPLFAFARWRSASEPAPWFFALLAIAALALAWLSWRFVERPFRDRRRMSTRVMVATLAGASAVVVAIAVAGQVTGGFRDHFRAQLSGDERRTFELLEARTMSRSERDSLDDGDCRFAVMTVDEGLSRRFEACHAKYGRALVVFGDSHAQSVFGALYREGSAKFVVGAYAYGVVPADPADPLYVPFRRFAETQAQAIEAVVHVEAGFPLFRDADGGEGSRQLFERRRRVPDYPLDQLRIDATLDYLTSLSPSVRVVWVGPWVEPHRHFRSLQPFIDHGFTIRPEIVANFERLDESLSARARERGGARVRYLSMTSLLRPDLAQGIVHGDCLLFGDGDHFSRCGQLLWGPRIKGALDGILDR